VRQARGGTVTPSCLADLRLEKVAVAEIAFASRRCNKTGQNQQ
jgi:hypothetical protein